MLGRFLFRVASKNASLNLHNRQYCVVKYRLSFSYRFIKNYRDSLSTTDGIILFIAYCLCRFPVRH